MLTATERQHKCYHCGEDCDDDELKYHDKFFCCLGCKSVFEILSDNGLCDYYNLEQTPGISLKTGIIEQRFAYLSNEAIQQKLHQFLSPSRNVITFHIPVIHCSSCIWLLENLDRLLTGVLHTRVNFPKKALTITYDPSGLTLPDLVAYLARLGYEPLITLADKPSGKIKKLNQLLYLKIGIAGFCFGNIMLLSFPEYLGLENVDEVLKKLFSYLSAFLSLPVLYAASPYFSAACKGIRQRYFNIDIPIALGIITLFLRSFYEILTDNGPGYFDSMAGLVFFLLIGKWFQSKTYSELLFERDYKSYFPLAVEKVVGNSTEPEQVNRLQPGDEIVVKNNEIIPADSVLMNQVASVDYSFVSGESMPVEKHKGDYIYAGGKQKGTSIRLCVEKPVSQSYLTQLWNNEAFERQDSEHQSFINKISKHFTLAVIAIAILAGGTWYWIDSGKMINVFTSVLIVACPCALALSAPFTLGGVMRVMGRAGLYLKNTQVIEKMSALTSIVFDKTGTITYGDAAAIHYIGNTLSAIDLQVIKSMVAHSSHPLSKLLSQYLKDVGELPLDHFEEIDGKGLVAFYKNDCYKIGSSQLLGEHTKRKSLKTCVYVAKSGEEMGSFVIGNKYRAGLGKVVKQLGTRFKLTVLSGDNSGESGNLQTIFGEGADLTFNKKPDEKLIYLESLQKNGHSAMMIGDGLNDAGALKQSDVGIVVADNINNFTPASDGILAAKSFVQLPVFIQLSRIGKRIIFASFALSIIYNAVGLGFAVTGLLTPILAAILMPLSSISVVVFTTFLVNLSAKRLNL